MAGDEGCKAVAGAKGPGGARSSGATRERGELTVGDNLTAPQRSQHARAIAVEAVIQVELDIGEVVRSACEERRQPSREDKTSSGCGRSDHGARSAW